MPELASSLSFGLGWLHDKLLEYFKDINKIMLPLVLRAEYGQSDGVTFVLAMDGGKIMVTP